MAVSHQSPLHQRGEGFRRVGENPPGLIGDNDDPVNHGPDQSNPKQGMNLTSSGGQPKRPLRRRGYKNPVD